MCVCVRACVSVYVCVRVCVAGPDKTSLIALFCISRSTNFNTVLLCWLDTVTPDILYNKCSYIAIIS